MNMKILEFIIFFFSKTRIQYQEYIHVMMTLDMICKKIIYLNGHDAPDKNKKKFIRASMSYKNI